MLKIYLDWNCITHLKENKEVYDFLIQNHNKFIFPYSPAHFEDLLRSLPRVGESKKFFSEDMMILKEICGDNLIMYDIDKKRVMPYVAKPEEYLDKNGSMDTTIDNIYKNATFTDFLKNREDKETYKVLSEMFKQKHLNELEIPFTDKIVKNGLELMDTLWNFQHIVMTTKDFNRNAKKQLNKEETKRALEKISYANYDTVFGVIEKQLNGMGFTNNIEIQIKKFLEKSKQDNELAMFISLYLALDISGFRQDKNRNMLNISTDAKHGYYASYCDVLVPNDKKMAEKNKAVYDKLKIKTKVIKLNELIPLIQTELEKEFDFIYYFRTVATNLHFHREYKKGDVHTRFLIYDSPFLGIFNYGMVQYFIDTKKIFFTFKIHIDERQYVFFTELDKFYDFVRIAIHEKSEIEKFNTNFVNKIKEKDTNANYIMNVDDKWYIVLANDNEHNGLPVLYITRKMIK